MTAIAEPPNGKRARYISLARAAWVLLPPTQPCASCVPADPRLLRKRFLDVRFDSDEGAKFRKPVVPGDRLRIEIDVLKKRSPFWKMLGKAFVESEVVCEAEVTAMVSEDKSAGGGPSAM